MENKQLEGVYNAAAPGPVSNENIMGNIREAMHMSIGLPAPKWLLEIGAVLIGTETELIFKSRWVVPVKLLQAGFNFEFPDIKEAVRNIVKK